MLLTLDHHKPAVLCVLDPRAQLYLEVGTGRWVEFGPTVLFPLRATAAAPLAMVQCADVALPRGELIVAFFEAPAPEASEVVGPYLGSTQILESPARVLGVYQR